MRLPPGFKNFSLSNNNNALCSLQNDELVKSDPLPVKPLTYRNEYCTRIRRMNGENLSEDAKKEKFNQTSTANLNVTSPSKVSFFLSCFSIFYELHCLLFMIKGLLYLLKINFILLSFNVVYFFVHKLRYLIFLEIKKKIIFN